MARPPIALKSAIEKIKDFYKEYRRMPSFQEMADLFGYASKNAVGYLVDKLVDKGILEKDERGKLLPMKTWSSFPLVGSVKAGFPTPAEEDLHDYLSFDDFLVENKEATYLVRVSGDSMIEAGIMPGDIVIVDRSRQARDGEIVIAEVDHDWTMKYLEKKSGKLRLLPANRKYHPILPSDELRIGGVVVGVIRKY